MHTSLKQFLNKKLYRHDKVRDMTDEAKAMIEVLFDRYMADPGQLPTDFAARASVDDGSATEKARVVADYIAGMTDRFAIAEYDRLN
jgi:dGTPase